MIIKLQQSHTLPHHFPFNKIQSYSMVSNIALLVLVILIYQTISASSAPTSQQIFCSAFCAPTGCTGWTSSDCNNKCNAAAKGWSASGGSCSITSAAFQFLDSSDDSGGMITVSPNTQTASCPNLTGYLGGVAPYGNYTATQVVTVTLAGGTSIGHYAVDLYFDLILVDVDDSGKKWNTGTKFTVTMVYPNTSTQAFNMSVTNNNPTTSYKVYCGDTGKYEQYFQYFNTYTHNLTDSDITFTITSNNNPANAIWVAKEFIYVLRLCNTACLTCNTSSASNSCFSCDPGLGYMLNNYSCLTTCTTGYGYTSDPAICIWCNLKCKACYEVFDNCTLCQTSGTYKSVLYYNDTLGYYTCVTTCPDGYFANTTQNTCDLCDPVCLTCSKNSTYCYSCVSGYGWNNYYCYQPCNEGYYYSNNNTNCTQCNLTCIACTDQLTCSSCTLNGTNMAYLQGVSCYKTCPDTYYGDTNYGLGPNTCLSCTATCQTCTDNPSPCQSCKNGSYLYNFTCGATCPNGTIAYAPLNECLDCTSFCVDLSINMYFPSSFADTLYIDMTFTKDLDFGTFNMTTFQTVSISSVSSSDYTVSYLQLSSSSYRIIIQPIGYIFLYNDTVTVTTKSQPATLETSSDGTPFKPTNYGKTAAINWFLLKSPSMTDMQKSIINQIGGISNVMAKATTAPFVAQIKKSGLLAMLFSGAQITTTSVLVNSIPAQNMYEGARFWGIFVFYDVPQWQQNSKIPNHAFSSETSALVKDQRRLFDLTTMYWRFQRIGQSSFFIYDVYMPLLLVLTCWVLAFIAYIWRRSDKQAFKSIQVKYWTVLHKIHEASILYVTIAMIMQWMYFDAASGARWLSFIICFTFTLYFVGYQLYVYHDMIKYPEAFIGNQLYEYYLTRYGTFLKNLRFQQYDNNEQWSPRHWFRPYNYHILSYYKKFCMIVSLPIFYDIEHMQPAILIILQLLEIARFIATKPYCARWRNIYRFVLELLLLFFFITVLINTFLINYITTNDPDLNFYVRLYYDIGWVGFVLVFAFNCGFVILMFVDLARSFKYTNREFMEEARRVYYYGKITEYQKENEEVPLNLMNRWVKYGNLNKRNMEELPDINVRIEFFKLVKHSEYFDVEILKLVELFMNTDLNYHKENNTTPGKKIKKRIKLSRETSKAIYHLMCDVFNRYAKKNTEAIVIKTFTHIAQRDFKAGDRIPLLPSDMFQKIELENNLGEKENIKLKEKLKGFPLNPFDLQSI